MKKDGDDHESEEGGGVIGEMGRNVHGWLGKEAGGVGRGLEDGSGTAASQGGKQSAELVQRQTCARWESLTAIWAVVRPKA